MEQPKAGATHVAHEALRQLVSEIAQKAGIPPEQAEPLSHWLIACDLRGVWTHGSRGMTRYVREIQCGGLNPRPNVRMVRESPVSVVMDGDGGLGYFPAHEGTLKVIDKARAHGMAALVTRNHGHIGAAGLYTRLTLEHDLIAFCTSGSQLNLDPTRPVVASAGGAPMSFSAPGIEEPPFVFDAGVTVGLHHQETREAIAKLNLGVVLRAIGFGTVCQAWGGLLTGMSVNQIERTYKHANQGAMLFACRIDLFTDPEEYKRKIDEYVRKVRQMRPLPGTEGAFLPGGIEAEHERAYREQGIPLGQQHREELEKLADELGLTVPWQ